MAAGALPDQVSADRHRSDLARVVLPKFLRPCLLLLLREYGPWLELRERLRLGFNRDNPGGCWRVARAWRRPGFVELGVGILGEQPRTYELTHAGEERLFEAVAELQAMHHVLDRFLFAADTAGVDGPRRMPYGCGLARRASIAVRDAEMIIIVGAGLGGCSVPPSGCGARATT